MNGVGKTTTIRALLGMSKPSSGKVYLFVSAGGWESRFVMTSRLYGQNSLCLPYLNGFSNRHYSQRRIV
ncbi:hypothetical protein [Paenibacillus tundrae]|uniref:hypothetical protein n=1 Tax=Paenibacillus tundrae TaxID=528187 RepID=UPI0027D91DCF|nr:hypothetical protein [Paenibacillus tundrae]